MNAEKMAAAYRLNQLENKNKIILENIDKIVAALAQTRVIQATTASLIMQQREAITAMPD